MRKFKTIYISLLFLLVFCFSSEKSYADNFASTQGDVNQSKFISVLSIEYSDLGDPSIQWDNSLVRGETNRWVREKTISDVVSSTTSTGYRLPNVATKVSVPPKSNVTIGSLSYSYSGHSITIHNLHLFTSAENPINGDLTRVGADGILGTFTMKNFETRTGKYVTIGNLGTYNNTWHYKGRIAYTFETIQPINLVSFTNTPVWNGKNLAIKYTLILENISDYALCGVNIKDTLSNGTVFNTDVCINPHARKEIEYYEEFGTGYSQVIQNDGVKVSDTNRHVESTTGILPSITDKDSANIPGIVVRDDDTSTTFRANVPIWGTTQSPAITVELLPYSFNIPSIVTNVTPEPKIEILNTSFENKTLTSDEEFSFDIKVSNTGARFEDTLEIIFDQSMLNIQETEFNVGMIEHGDTKTFHIQGNVNHLDTGKYPTDISIKLVNQNVQKKLEMKIDTFAKLESTVVCRINCKVDFNDTSENEIVSRYGLTIENVGNSDAYNILINVKRNGEEVATQDWGIIPSHNSFEYEFNVTYTNKEGLESEEYSIDIEIGSSDTQKQVLSTKQIVVYRKPPVIIIDEVVEEEENVDEDDIQEDDVEEEVESETEENNTAEETPVLTPEIEEKDDTKPLPVLKKTIKQKHTPSISLVIKKSINTKRDKEEVKGVKDNNTKKPFTADHKKGVTRKDIVIATISILVLGVAIYWWVRRRLNA